MPIVEDTNENRYRGKPLQRPIRRSWALMMIVVSCVLTAALSMAYSSYAAAEQGKSWCDLLETFNRAYQDTPPTTPTGKKIAEGIEQLYRDINCPGKGDSK